MQVKTPIPFLLKHPLREYQHIGLDWLVSLYTKRLNGILADEMVRDGVIAARCHGSFFPRGACVLRSSHVKHSRQHVQLPKLYMVPVAPFLASAHALWCFA
jgi:hypothetical protein